MCDSGGQTAGHEPTVCIQNPETQLCPGKEQAAGEGEDSSFLLCSCKTSPGILHPARRAQHKKGMDMLKALRGLEHLGCEDKMNCSSWRREGSRETSLQSST